MNQWKAWSLGCVLIVIFILLSEATVVFRDFFFSRLGLNRNITLLTLWMIPIVASFITVFLSKGNKLLFGLSFIPILTILAPTFHLIVGEIGVAIDYRGLAGLEVTLKLYLIISLITITLGSIIGWVLGKTGKGSGSQKDS